MAIWAQNVPRATKLTRKLWGRDGMAWNGQRSEQAQSVRGEVTPGEVKLKGAAWWQTLARLLLRWRVPCRSCMQGETTATTQEWISRGPLRSL